tara:strand:+ start:1158 stop:1832 length:675 start_codon:yes stop_codon:yes gene_type:complete
MKIHIFFRHYNISGNDNKGRPLWFDFEKCFINLLSTINDQQVDLHVIMDGKIKENWINKYSSKFILHEIEAGSDPSSFHQTYEIAKNTKIGEDDLVYFLENDYLHIVGWVDKVKDLFETYNLMHYVSLYDHNDKYFPHYEDLVSKIIVSPTYHWRTTPSTCGSFIIKKQLFDLDFDIHTTIVGDHNKFIDLYRDRQRLVITPIPGLSTHCMQGLLSPTINWELI